MTSRRETILPKGVNRNDINNASKELIINTILEFHGVGFEGISLYSRKREIVDVRHIINYFLTVKNDLTFFVIADIFKKDHTTVMHSRKQVESWIATDKYFNEKIINIANLIILKNYEERRSNR
jgi:chromosomal replication initiation ATPase DnaA